MATVSNREIVNQIIEGNGVYMDDDLVVKIVEYHNMFNGDLAWGIIYHHEDLNRYHESAACIRPRTIWEHQSIRGNGNGSF